MNKPTLKEEQLLWAADQMFDICKSADKKISIFDGFLPLLDGLSGFSDDDKIFFTDVEPNALDFDANISVFGPGFPDLCGAKKEWQFHRVRKISTKELRKRAGIFTPNPYSLEIAFENHRKIENAFFTFRNGKPVVLDIPNTICDQKTKEEIKTTAQMTLAAQFILENTPHVYLKPEGSQIGFTYPLSSLSQVKELFSLRDIPDGYKRRAALKHWVVKHQRRNAHRPEDKIDVKKHLRGKEHFTWFGMEGAIFVPSKTQ